MNLTSIVIAVLVPVILGLLPKLIPFIPAPNENFSPIDILEKRYRKWYILGNIIIFPVMIISVIAVYFILDLLSERFLNEFNDHLLILKTEPTLFGLPAIFIGIFLAAGIMMFFTIIIMKDNVAEYLYYENIKSGYHITKLLKYMAFSIIPLMIIISVLCLDTYAVIYPDKIVINEFSTLTSKTYHYTQISSIKESSEILNTEKPTGYQLVFSDGYKWDSNSELYKYDKKQQDVLAELLLKFRNDQLKPNEN